MVLPFWMSASSFRTLDSSSCLRLWRHSVCLFCACPILLLPLQLQDKRTNHIIQLFLWERSQFSKSKGEEWTHTFIVQFCKSNMLLLSRGHYFYFLKSCWSRNLVTLSMDNAQAAWGHWELVWDAYCWASRLAESEPRTLTLYSYSSKVCTCCNARSANLKNPESILQSNFFRGKMKTMKRHGLPKA